MSISATCVKENEREPEFAQVYTQQKWVCGCVCAGKKKTIYMHTSDKITHNLSLKLCLCTVAVRHGDIITHCAKCIC